MPGTAFAFTQPIEMRVDELVAGVKADVAVLLYGDDLEVLGHKGKEIERGSGRHPRGSRREGRLSGQRADADRRARREQLARYGIDAQDVLDAVSTAGGYEVGKIYRGPRRFPHHRSLSASIARGPRAAGAVPVHVHEQQIVPLGELAEVDSRRDAARASSTKPAGAGRSCNAMSRTATWPVSSAKRKRRSATSVQLPPSYRIEWGGDFENLQSASRRLAIITPIVLLLIFLLLHTSLKSVGWRCSIFLAVPMAASGGIFALWLRDMPFSISAGVGFIALFGVAVLNGLVWVSAASISAKKACRRTRRRGKRPSIACGRC